MMRLQRRWIVRSALLCVHSLANLHNCKVNSEIPLALNVYASDNYRERRIPKL